MNQYYPEKTEEDKKSILGFLEGETTEEQYKAIFTNLLDRVVIDDNGHAQAPKVRDAMPVMVFIRDDGWSCGTPTLDWEYGCYRNHWRTWKWVVLRVGTSFRKYTGEEARKTHKDPFCNVK